MQNFFRGLVSGFRAGAFLLGHKQFLSVVFFPLVIHILVGVGAVFAVYWIMIQWIPLTLPAFVGSWDGVWPFLTQAGTFLFQLGICLFLFLLIYLLGFTLFCPMFYAWMVEKFETSLGVEKSYPPISLRAQIIDSLALVLFFLVGHGIIFLIFWIPFIGAIGAFLGAIAFQAYCLGLESMDYSLSLRGLRFREKLKFANQRKTLALGIGTVPLVFIAVPILNACLLTLATLGATFLVREELPFETKQEP